MTESDSGGNDAISDEAVVRLFTAHDTNKDGSLSREELTSLLRDSSGVRDVTEDSPELTALFASLDTNSDGAVSILEMSKRSGLQKLREAVRSLRGNHGGVGGAVGGESPLDMYAEAAAANLRLTDDELRNARELFCAADGDGDGLVSMFGVAPVLRSLGWTDPLVAKALFEKVGLAEAGGTSAPGNGVSFVEFLHGVSLIPPRPRQRASSNPLRESGTVVMQEESPESRPTEEGSDTDSEAEGEGEGENSKQDGKPTSVDEVVEQQNTAATTAVEQPKPFQFRGPPKLALGSIANHPSNPSAAFGGGGGGSDGGRIDGAVGGIAGLHMRQNSRILSTTGRRQQLNAVQYLQRQADVLAWVSKVTGREVTDISQLTNGAMLCEMCNKVKAGMVPNCHRNPGNIFMSMENALAVSVAASRIGLNQAAVFAPSDLVQKANLPKVFGTLDLFAKAASKDPYNCEFKYEPSPTPGKFTREQIQVAEAQLRESEEIAGAELSAQSKIQREPSMTSVRYREQTILLEHKRQVGQLQESVEFHKREAREAKEEVGAVRKRVAEYERMLASMTEEKETLHVKCAGLEKRIVDDGIEIARMKEELDGAKKRVDTAESTTEERSARLKELTAELEAMRSSCTGKDARIAELEKAASTETSRGETVEAELLRRIAELEEELRLTKEQFAALKDAYEKLLALHKASDGRSKESEKQLNGTIVGLQKELAATKSDLDDERDRVVHFKATIEQMREELDQKHLFAQKEAERLSDELKKQVDAIAGLEKQLKEGKRASEKAASGHQEELAKVREEASATASAAVDREAAANKALDESRQLVAALQAQAAAAQEANKATERALTKRLAEAKAATVKEKELRAKAEAEVGSVRAESRNTSQEEARLTKEMKEHASAMKTLRNQSDVKDAKLAAVTEERDKLRKDLEQAQLALAKAKRDSTKRPSSSGDRPNSRQQQQRVPDMVFGGLRSEDLPAGSQEQQFMHRIEDLNVEIAALKAMVADLKAQNHVLLASKKPDSSEITKLRAEYDRVCKALDRVGKENEELKVRLRNSGARTTAMAASMTKTSARGRPSPSPSPKPPTATARAPSSRSGLSKEAKPEAPTDAKE